MLHDIHKVCEMLRTTSRTLRYYEEKGLITSQKHAVTLRRQYSDTQIDCIRNILALRAIGLPLKAIVALQKKDITLRQAILSRRAEIEASIHSKCKELAKLSNALTRLDITQTDTLCETNVCAIPKAMLEVIVHSCRDAIVHEDVQTLYTYFTPRLQTYLPQSAYVAIWHDTAIPLGTFLSYESTLCDSANPNVIYQRIRFEKLGLTIKFVFHADRINGLWMDYYEPERSRTL